MTSVYSIESKKLFLFREIEVINVKKVLCGNIKWNMKVASYKTFNKNFSLKSVVNDFALAIFPNKLKLTTYRSLSSET